jgi:hypothetical protein
MFQGEVEVTFVFTRAGRKAASTQQAYNILHGIEGSFFLAW